MSAAEASGLETRTLESCPACGGRTLRPLAMRYEFRGTRFPAVECATCAMRFLAVQPAGASLASLYAGEYFERDYRCGRVAAHSFDEAAFRDENRGLLDEFERLRPPGRLLEVGPAAGFLLRQAAERGWTATGVELSAAAVARARALGLTVLEGTLRSARLPDASADLVFLGDVLEHVPDCRADLEEVARVLAPGGFLYLRGPITTNSLARRLGLALYGLWGRSIVLREPPYHLWEFRPGPLRRLCAAVGLEVVALRQSKLPPGRAHGEKTGLQRAAMALIDAVNLPITVALGRLGDRCVLVARKPAV